MSDDLDQLPPLTIKLGATKSFRFTALGVSGPLDITGGLAWFSVKKRFEDTVVLISKRSTSAGGPSGQVQFLSQSGATLGKWDALCIPPDTSNLLPGSYVCDAWVQLATGERYVCAERYFIVEPVVTTKFPTT